MSHINMGEEEEAQEFNETIPRGEGSDTPETKSEAFKRLATSRLTKAIKAIETLGNCADTANYEYTQEQADIVTGQLKLAVTNINNRFNGIDKDPEKEANPFGF